MMFLFSSYIYVMWVWVYDVVERGIEGVHYEFHYEWLGFKKGCRQRESPVPYETNCVP